MRKYYVHSGVGSAVVCPRTGWSLAPGSMPKRLPKAASSEVIEAVKKGVIVEYVKPSPEKEAAGFDPESEEGRMVIAAIEGILASGENLTATGSPTVSAIKKNIRENTGKDVTVTPEIRDEAFDYVTG